MKASASFIVSKKKSIVTAAEKKKKDGEIITDNDLARPNYRFPPEGSIFPLLEKRKKKKKWEHHPLSQFPKAGFVKMVA